MDEDKRLLNASKDEHANDSLHVMKHNPAIDEIRKLHHASNLSSAPIQINVPINPSLETIGALCELETAETNSSRGSTDNEDGNSTDDRPLDNFPQCLEDLIQLEHNYAAIFINTLERNENEETAEVNENQSAFTPENQSVFSFESQRASLLENNSAANESKTALIYENKDASIPENKSASIHENKSASIPENKSASIPENKSASSPVKVVTQLVNSYSPIEELTFKLSPVRRSKRQIEKQERELIEKEVGDAFQENAKDPHEIKEQSNSSVAPSDLSFDIENAESESYCSNYKSFADFKKRHLKIVIEDCRYIQNLESKRISEKDLVCHSLNTENKDESVVDGEHSSENSETPLQKKVLSRTKFAKNKSVEKININIPSLRKRKILKADSEKDVVQFLKSDKNTNIEDVKQSLPKHKISKKSSESEQKINEVDAGYKKQKLSTSSENIDLLGENTKPTVVSGNKRRKTVSFSDDLVLYDKPEIPEKKQSLVDCKISPQKNISPIVSPTAKSQKKKVARRESFRLVVNEDEPPLFSQPDVMIKVKSDDVIKKDEKEGDQNLSDQDLDMKNQICSTSIEESNSTDKPSPSNELAVDDKSEKQNVSDPINHQHPIVTQSSEIKESLLEHCSSAPNPLIKAENICEDKHRVIKNDLDLKNNISDLKSFDIVNSSNLAYDKELNTLENASKQDCNNDANNENLNDTNKDKSSTNISDGEKFTPERKSRRVIKKKEFFEDTIDVTESKKSPKQQDMKPNAEKENAGIKKLASKSRCSNMSKEERRYSENTNSDIDAPMNSDESEEDDPDKLWCICRKPHNARFMIQCDKCEDWFHGSCVGVTKLFGRQLEKLKKEWWCPNCRVQGDSVSQNVVKVLEDPFIGSGFGKVPQRKDKEIKLDDQNDLIHTNKPTYDTKPRESTIKPEESTIKPQESTIKPQESTIKPQESTIKPQESTIKPQESTIKPQESTTKTKEPIIKPKESFLKNSLGRDKNLHAGLIDDSKSSKIISSSDHIEKNKSANLKGLKAPDTALQKQLAHIETKASDHLKSQIKKKSIIMVSKPVVQHKLLNTSPQTHLVTMTQATPPTKYMSLKNTQRNVNKQICVLPSNKKILNPSKEKGAVVKKKQTCVQCQTEAKVNSCYCSDNCIDKHVAQCLKSMRETKGTPKGSDFDTQRLVVFDRLKGSVITNGPTAKEIVSWLKTNPSYMIVFTPSAKKETVSQKKECDSSTGTEKSTDEAAKATVRLNVRKTLKNILMDRCKNADDIQLLEEDVQRIANKIEEELRSLFKDNSFKYRAKYRSLMFNIKDPRNQGLFRKILKGNIPPERLVRMSSEELASIELAKWREQENQHLLDLIKREQLEQQKTVSGLLLKKTHKGEVEIEDDLTDIIEQDVPKAITKDISEELVESEKEVKNTTHLHRSHLFDLNCKICTGKVVPPPVDESISKKVRVAHSISVDNHSPSDSVERSVSRIVEGKSPLSSTGEDSMDQEPTSTVSIGSPEIAVKRSTKNFPSKSVTSVWKGFIFMQDIAKFVTSAYKVSGKTDQLRTDLPDTIQVCGRIIPDQVWDYLGKIKQSGNKELIIIHFQPANDEEAVAYHSFYSYLSSKKRYGVVSNYSKKIKDFYLLPLAAASPVPMVLVPFDGPGLPSPRPHLLLGVIVRHKLKQVSTSTTPKQKPLPKVEVIKKTSRSYTPSPEPRSYTPPLPTSQSSDESSKPELEVLYSPVAEFKSIAKLDESQMVDLKNEKKVTHNIIPECSSSSSENKSSDSNVFSSVKDEDKPYDPEQDILNLTSEKKVIKTMHASNKKRVKGSDHLEQHKKILDALTRQVEETDRQVNAMKQLIAVPEDEVGMQSPNTSSIDINSVAETGMSSFLDLPDNLQEILNTVRLKSCDKLQNIHEKGDVDMRIKDLFGKQLNFETDDEPPHSLYKVASVSKSAKTNTAYSNDAYSSQAATPPPTEENDKPLISGPSDPRIKLRTSFHAQFLTSNDVPKASLSSMSASELILHAQKQFKDEKCKDSIPPLPQETKKFSTIGNELSSNWSSDKEPPPPGVESRELSVSQNRVSCIPTVAEASVPPTHASNSLVQNSSQQVHSMFPQLTSSFPTHLPQGFSVHTPPPNIQHYPPLIAPPSFPPPPLPIQIPPPKENESAEDPWPIQQHSSFGSEAGRWENNLNQWDGSKDQVAQPINSTHHSSEGSNVYHNEPFYKKGSSNRHWEKQQGYSRGHWNPQYQRGNRFGSRRGNRSTFKRSQRN